MSRLQSEAPTPIPFARPWLGDEEAAAATRAIQSGWVTQGPEVEAFEAEFATLVGAAHACAVSSGTAALHLALLAVGVEPGDEVITVSHSFIATANAIRHANAIPVFVDIDAATGNIDPERVEEAITRRTRAIVGVHQMGMPFDVAFIGSIAGRHGLALIEDAACAVGSAVQVGGQWERIGRPHGDVACFSFHPRKLLTTGDGGMITTRAADWDRQCRLLRHQGMSVSDRARAASRSVVIESYEVTGFNYRLTDIQAAVGRTQLKRLPQILQRRRAQAERYHRLLADVSTIGVPHEPGDCRTNWQSYPVRLPPGVNAPAVMQRMLDAGIATRRGIMCAHREAPYAAAHWSERLSISEQVSDATVLLPIFHQLTEQDQQRVVDALCTAVDELVSRAQPIGAAATTAAPR